MTPKRIYLMRDTHSGDETLVRAPNSAQALRHVTADQFAVGVASQAQLVTLLTGGAKVEESGSQAQVAEAEPVEPEPVEEREEQS